MEKAETAREYMDAWKTYREREAAKGPWYEWRVSVEESLESDSGLGRERDWEAIKEQAKEIGSREYYAAARAEVMEMKAGSTYASVDRALDSIYYQEHRERMYGPYPGNDADEELINEYWDKKQKFERWEKTKFIETTEDYKYIEKMNELYGDYKKPDGEKNMEPEVRDELEKWLRRTDFKYLFNEHLGDD